MDNRTGDKIQNIADVVFVCTIVLTAILGICYMAILRGITGFLVLLLVAGIGVFAAFVYKYLMQGFGEIVAHQAEQTRLLQRLTEYMRQNAVSPGAVRPESVAAPFASSPPVQPLVQSGSVPGAEQTPTARFATRRLGDIACPVCHKRQMSNRDSCYACGCRFIYEDEQPSRP